MKNYLLTGIIALLIGGIVGYFLHKPETKVIPGETITVYQDTCISNNIIADVTTETKTTTSGSVKKGGVQKETSIFPIEEVAVQDSDIVTTFSKSYNTGLMKMKVTATVTSKSKARAKIDMEYSLDTLLLKEMTTVVNTVVVSKDTTDSVPTEVTKYLPFESTSKQTWVGIGGSIKWNEKPVYDLGLNLQNGKTTFGLYVDPLNIKELESFRLQLNRNLFKVSGK